MGRPQASLIGKVFERWTVVGQAPHVRGRNTRWHCECACGNEGIVDTATLLKGASKSCGCLRKEATTSRNILHGESHSLEFRAWIAMRNRCKSNKYYVGRVAVCARWEPTNGGSFLNFLADMGRKPTPAHSLGRVKNEKGYSPENCTWQTAEEQSQNRELVLSPAEHHVRLILRDIGENPYRSGLCDTPGRVVKSWKELYAGYGQNPVDILSRTFPPEGFEYDEMILCKGVELYSMCEHHMLPFTGQAHVAYIPGQDGYVVGLSKLARLVECFSRRLQIQEKLTNQIAQALEDILKPKGVAVVIEAKHHCMCSRGVGKQNSTMITSALRGVFKTKPAARAEFLQLIKQ